MEKIALDSKAASAISFQTYTPQSILSGVTRIPLKKHRALEGDFCEYLRITEGKIEGLPISFDARQISFSRAVPGRLNAFHIHPKQVQDELWCVLEGTLLVWLIDLREESPTCNQKCQFILSGEEPSLLLIPSGVAHGYKAGAEGALLLYAMNAQFNINDPNEGRLPWDYFGSDLWDEDRG